MPNIKSAIKRVRTSTANAKENAIVKTSYKTAVKNFEEQVNAGNKDKATESFKAAVKAIERAAKTGVIKDNTASRKKANLTKALNNIK